MLSATPVFAEESLDRFVVRYDCNELVIPVVGDVNIIKSFPARDNINIFLKFGDAEPVYYNSASTDWDAFIKNATIELSSREDDEQLMLEILINKSTVDNNISIYSIENFTKYLSALESEGLLNHFSRFTSWDKKISLICFECKEVIQSSLFILRPESSQFNSSDLIDFRKKRFDSIKSSVHTNITKLGLIPDDFEFSNVPVEYKGVIEVFKKALLVLCVASIVDISDIKGNLLTYKLNGYKSINGQVDLSKPLNKDVEDYFTIYNWIYLGGSLTDKIGLARNIISLHLDKVDGYSLHGYPFQSILSGFKVYEKQNIKQYIEIRNKVSDQLLSFNERANKVIETFASGFQKSALALISFYISAIALKILGKGEVKNVFTLESTLLSMGFLSISLIYFIVSRWEVKQQRKRFSNSYFNLKERYTDLLDEGDIERILNKDKEYKEDVSFIDKKLKNYSIMWLCFLGILFLITIVLFITNNPSQLFQTQLWQLLFSNSCNC